MTSDNRSEAAQLYFKDQGHRIAKLFDLLNANVSLRLFKKLLSETMEWGLYILFVVITLLMIFSPTDPQYYFRMDETTRLRIVYENENFTSLVLTLKCIVILIALPLPVFAFVLGRLRKKNQLIHQAFIAVREMKDQFEKAVKETPMSN